MTTFGSTTRAGQPFGPGLQDEDLKLLVASSDMRGRQLLKALIVNRSSLGRAPVTSMAAELIVENTDENLVVLKAEAHRLDPNGRLGKLAAGDLADIVLESPTTGERVMITLIGPVDYNRLEQLAGVMHVQIGTNDRGRWVCRVIDSDRLDALFGGRVIDISSN